jgi:hypothetical protein
VGIAGMLVALVCFKLLPLAAVVPRG